MKYSKELNGVMLAENPTNKYIVLFENGKSLQGLHFSKDANPISIRYFGESNFTASSNDYEYTLASPEDRDHLFECIIARKFISKKEALEHHHNYQIY